MPLPRVVKEVVTKLFSDCRRISGGDAYAAAVDHALDQDVANGDEALLQDAGDSNGSKVSQQFEGKEGNPFRYGNAGQTARHTATRAKMR